MGGEISTRLEGQVMGKMGRVDKKEGQWGGLISTRFEGDG